ncbi:hypothetical protein P7L70_19520 [Tistrella mobilis]|uniref:hypothetical protein n=1 Tax=Tistrella mobilis TaxID=171437 RepID=UPI0035579A5A
MDLTGRPAPACAVATALPRLRHRPGPLIADLARAAAGGAVIALPLLVVDGMNGVLQLALIALVLLFAAFAVQRGLKLTESWTADGHHIVRRGAIGQSRLDVSRLRTFRLEHFAPRKGAGWFRLRLVDDGGVRLAAEDTLEDFHRLVALALAAAEARALPLDDVTTHNLAALGLARGIA